MLLPHEPLSGKGLIEATFRLEDLPDARLYRRLETIASGMLRSVLHERDERPQPTKRAERRGAARLYANERVDSDLLASRAQQRCAEAIAQLPSLLVAHDSSEFDLHGRNEPCDAGPLRSSQARGYLVHNGVVLDPQSEARVGMLYLRCWSRPFPQGKPRPEGHISVKQEWKNEDNKWFWGVEKAHRALDANGFAGEVRHVADHEGSSYATLAKCKRRRRNYLTRTKGDRCIREGCGKLYEHLQAQPVVEEWTVQVVQDNPSRARGAPRHRRIAHVELRFAPVTLKPTDNYGGRLYRKGLRVWAVYVVEPNAPQGSEPLEWMLLSTVAVTSTAEARDRVTDYACRWGVEDVYKVIKSGCHAELTTVPNLAAFKRLMAVVWPIALHMMRWTYAARVKPLEPAAPYVDEETLDALKEASRYHKLPLPRRAWTLSDVILRLAQMGGYELRKGHEPGWQVIWRGWKVFHNFWDHLRFIQARAGAQDAGRRGGPPPQRDTPEAAPLPSLPPRGSPTKQELN
jgi:hypothetical protein